MKAEFKNNVAQARVPELEGRDARPLPPPPPITHVITIGNNYSALVGQNVKMLSRVFFFLFSPLKTLKLPATLAVIIW